MAPGVVNNGQIQAQMGQVVLAAGETFTVSFAGNSMISFAINDPVKKAAPGQKDGVLNTGSIIADGGTIQVSAKAAQGVLDNAINMGGVVQAKYAENDHQSGGVNLNSGQVVELDGGGGNVKVAGSVNVSGKEGGVVRVAGNTIEVTATGNIEANGKNGGGQVILLGG